MTVGEFYRRLVVQGPELIAYAQFYETVKTTLAAAEKEFRDFSIYKPKHRLEYIERTIKKWFGGVTPIRDKNPDEYHPYNGHKNGKPAIQKTPILENELSKNDYPLCFGKAFTQPECRMCCYLIDCKDKRPDCFGAPFPTDESIPECQLCPHLDACCKDALRMEAEP